MAELLAIRKIPGDLLARPGVAQIPKQVLVEIGRAPETEQPRLINAALSGASLDDVRGKRSNRAPRVRVVYFRERFLLDGSPPIEIRWRRHPDVVTDDDLVGAFAAIALIVANRSRR